MLVKGMEMPDSCYHCKIAESCGRYITNYTDRRHPECPLVEIPEKHGDLIDRDEVRNAVYHHLSIKREENLLPAEKSIFGNLIKAKAVIESEDGT